MDLTGDLKIKIPEGVCEILSTLKSHGYEAFIVGGCVRDAVIGRKPDDWDITTSALPYEVKSLFHSTVDTGIQHGTVMVIKGGTGYEVTTYRVDGEYKDGRHPENVSFTRSLTEDLKRRDFTINAMAYDPERAAVYPGGDTDLQKGSIVDPFNGMADLKNDIIRCVGDPDKRFAEDALRVMRAVRFSAQLSFNIEPETKRQIALHSFNLSKISMERIRVEFEKTLMSDNPSYIDIYRELGIAGYITGQAAEIEKCFDPQVYALLESFKEAYKKKSRDCESENTEGSKELSLWEKERILRLGAFMMELSGKEINDLFRHLKYDNRTRELTAAVLKYKDEMIEPEVLSVRKALGRMGQEIFFLLAEFKAAGKPMSDEQEKIFKLAKKIISEGQAVKISQLKITGKDLIDTGIGQGPDIGRCLEALLQKVIEDPSRNRKEWLLKETENELKGSLR